MTCGASSIFGLNRQSVTGGGRQLCYDGPNKFPVYRTIKGVVLRGRGHFAHGKEGNGTWNFSREMSGVETTWET
jgi:hypothetical protein